MDSTVLKSVLGKRRDRCIAIILSVKERECDDELSYESSRKMRKAVLDQVNDFHDFTLDILSSLEGGVMLNDIWLDRLSDMYDAVSNLAERYGES